MTRALVLALLLLFVAPMRCSVRRVLIVPDYNDVHADPGWYGKPTYYADYVLKTKTI